MCSALLRAFVKKNHPIWKGLCKYQAFGWRVEIWPPMIEVSAARYRNCFEEFFHSWGCQAMTVILLSYQFCELCLKIIGLGFGKQCHYGTPNSPFPLWPINIVSNFSFKGRGCLSYFLYIVFSLNLCEVLSGRLCFSSVVLSRTSWR